MSEREEVKGAKTVIRFEGKRCIHARHCVLSRPDVFVPNVPGTWIHPDRASPADVAALAHACPSGAITYEPLDGSPAESAPVVNLIRVRENGPLAVHAELVVAGNPDGFRATLCRCGASGNKPYCDGSHNAASFRATGEPDTKASEPLAARAGALRVTPLPNGPLLVEGNAELVSGTGRTINRVTKTALCRCGQSSSKPYCDGTHTKVGFQG